MKKVLVITYDKVDDSELMYPLYRLEEAGFEYDVCSLEKKTIHAKIFVTAEATLLPEETDTSVYDALYLPGGSAPEKLRQNARIKEIAREFVRDGKPVCAICHGPLILISAGLVKGRKATCYAGVRDDLINAGAIYSDEAVVTDGCLITSRHPKDLPAMMKAFVAAINAK
ncbi:MAG: type 1 glutamine amidotransferase [Clostridia bacterium]|nr:type 1 glutamine amidotransferase [Clostridia bacterium]